MRLSFVTAAAATFLIAGLSQAEAETVPERLMTDLQSDFEFADFQAAGIVGNLARETGNFRYMQEISPLVSGSRGGVGYSQWTASRRVSFENWAAENNHDDMMSYEANYGFLKEELNGSYRRVVSKVKETDSVEEASRVFMKYFLAPHPSYTHLDERISYAEAYLEGDFSGAGCQEQHEIYNQDNMIILKMCPEQEEQTITVAEGLSFSEEFSEEALDRILTLRDMDNGIIAVSSEVLSYGLHDPDRVEHEGENGLRLYDAVITDPFASFEIVEADKANKRPGFEL
ncbi:phage tail tip lysozyme [Pseudosulfitobacter pseudonitzschiae]|uniref:phage tail tip lysozyme n=1 Tax=Pseudosulfitobacter pseudonitzschiae TaxID=1402135 RepID=UPI003B7C56A4